MKILDHNKSRKLFYFFTTVFMATACAEDKYASGSDSREIHEINFQYYAGIDPNSITYPYDDDELDRAAISGDGSASFILAMKLMDEVEVTESRATLDKAIGFLSMSCKSSNATSCGILGNIYQYGVPGMLDTKNGEYEYYQDKSFSIVSEGCQSDDYNYCAMLVPFYIEGTLTEADPDKAFDLARLTCEKEVAFGCYYYGLMHSNGVPFFSVDRNLEGGQSFQRAVHGYKKSCDLGFADGCAALARVYLRTDTPDEATDRQVLLRAEQAYKEACRAKHVLACSKLAEGLETFDGLKN